MATIFQFSDIAKGEISRSPSSVIDDIFSVPVDRAGSGYSVVIGVDGSQVEKAIHNFHSVGNNMHYEGDEWDRVGLISLSPQQDPHVGIGGIVSILRDGQVGDLSAYQILRKWGAAAQDIQNALQLVINLAHI